MINKQWFDAKKKIDPDFAGSLFEEIGFDKELCPTCDSHLKDKICLNACHLSKETQEKFNKFLIESNDKKEI